ncbi:formyltransferase family protein [Winogradskya humida]|uniref:Formyl transferase N-terminal domain-containing protein n=1 Tax=Winogradskya humida TaxID=113566 RepID=A0ABQ3ZY80_9ACTN|nr:formyltransferase family protein [Actinoplanes humidus]GIE23519.1 hypothetical protein Ahu01nite_066210 [Actinoplanes humidus]
MGYPRLIPPSLLAVPKYGAVNVHPSALPAGRGPNPARQLYEGASTLGATLHRTDAERILDLREPAAVIRRRAVALNVLFPSAQVTLPDPIGTVVIRHVDIVPTTAGATTPGTVLLTHADGGTVRAGEGAVRLTH